MPSRLVIDRPEQMEALASPVRNHLHLVLEMAGASSVGEIAALTGRTPESLYYHLRKLERVGIVERRGERRTAGRSETVYALAGDRLVVDPRQRSPRFLRAYARGAATLLRYVERCFRRAAADPSIRRTGPARTLRVQQVHVRLGPAALADLNRRLDEALREAEAADAPDARDHCVVTIAVCPTSLGDDD